MDIKSFLYVLKKRWLSITIVLLGVFLLTGTLSFYLVKPTYESVENIVVGKLNKKDSEYGDTQELNMLLASTIDFVKSPTVINRVKNEFTKSYKDLEEMIVVQNTDNSQIVSIVVRGNNAEETSEIAKFVALTTVGQMNKLFSVEDIAIMSEPSGAPPVEQVGSLKLNLAIGTVIGLFLGIAIAMFREHLDESIKSSRELEALLEYPVLGEVHLKKKAKKYKRKAWSKTEAGETTDEKPAGVRGGDVRVHES